MKQDILPSDVIVILGLLRRQSQDMHSPLAELLTRHGENTLRSYFDEHALFDVLDDLFGSVHQYPFRALTDGTAVLRYRPRGQIILKARSSSATLRGIIFGWAAGNEVAVSTAHTAFWRGFDECVQSLGTPIPRLVLRPDESSVASVISVPEIVTSDITAKADVQRPGTGADGLADQAIIIHGSVPPNFSPLRFDRGAVWLGQLFHTEQTPFSPLDVLRSALPPAAREHRLDARVRLLLHFARQSEFYRRYTNVNSISELSRLGFLTKRDLERNSLPQGTGLKVGWPPSGEVLRTGGTSSAPRFITYAQKDWAAMVCEAVPLFYALGLRTGDRVINTLFGGGMYGGMTTTVCEFSIMPVECYTMGQGISVADLLNLRRTFDANVLVGVPSLILPLLREAKHLDPEFALQTIIYGGVPLAASDRTWLQRELGVTTITSILAANDGAQIGYQCPHLRGTHHHLCDDFSYVEIVDDTGAVVDDGNVGKIAVTAWQKLEAPLIRYLIGDIGRVSFQKCACGVEGRVLEYLGRADRYVKFFRRSIDFEELFQILQEFSISHLQLEVESIDHAETLTIRIETPTDVDPLVVTDFLTGHYHGLSDRHEFDRALETFSFCVECYPEGGLSRDPVSGKVRPVIDRRLAGIENLNMAGQDEDSLRPDAPTRDFPTLTTRV